MDEPVLCSPLVIMRAANGNSRIYPIALVLKGEYCKSLVRALRTFR